jgi:hypothetical protein
MDNPRETGNLGYARHMTKTNKQCKKKTTQKPQHRELITRSNADPTKIMFGSFLLQIIFIGVNVLSMLFVFIDVCWCLAQFPYHMMYVSFNSNTTGDTSGAETGNPFGFLIPYCTVYFIGIIVIPFVLFLLTIFCLFCDLRLLFIPLISIFKLL